MNVKEQDGREAPLHPAQRTGEPREPTEEERSDPASTDGQGKGGVQDQALNPLGPGGIGE
jgi:hypothetical protein